MDERVMQFRVGASFFGALLFAGILLFLFGKLPTFVGHYNIKARFDNAGGITIHAPVRINGVLIGRVKDIDLTDNDESVLLTLEIESGKTVYKNETPYITRDLMGNAAVVFIPSGVKGRRVAVAAGETVEGKYSSDPTGLKRELQGPMDTVENTGKALAAASRKLEMAADRVNAILNPDAQQNVQDILHDAAQSLKVINEVLGDKENQKRLAKSLGKLPETIDSMNDTFVTADRALRKFTEPTGPEGDKRPAIDRLISTIELTERTLREFSESTDPNHPAPSEQITKAVANINEITDLMRSIMSRIDRGEGSLGALLKDDQLYRRLNRAAGNIEQSQPRASPDRRGRRRLYGQGRPASGRNRPRRRQAGRRDQVATLRRCGRRSRFPDRWGRHSSLPEVPPFLWQTGMFAPQWQEIRPDRPSRPHG